jgi:hypothetical protein
MKPLQKALMVFFALLSFSYILHAENCTGSSYYHIPAVMGTKGLLVEVSMQLMEGTGELFVTTHPRVDITTQDSLNDAVDYAFNYTGKDRKSCDAVVQITLPEGVSGSIEGPSGGAAFSTMAVSALEGYDISQDTIITGGIRRDGSIFPVGGIYEKAGIAGETGKKYIITPQLGIFERVLLKTMRERYNITVVEASNLSEALGVAVFGRLPAENVSAPQIDAINSSIPEYPDGMKGFVPVAREMMSQLNSSVSRIDSGTWNEEQLGGYYGTLFSNEQLMMVRGYYFSAANDAFLSYIDSESLASIDGMDIASRKASVMQCVSGLRYPQMTSSNRDWLAGAHIRAQWARMKMAEVSQLRPLTMDEKYSAYHELLYADAWCKIAGMLIENAPKGGESVNESALEGLSAGYLADMKLFNSTDSDNLRHRASASALHDSGDYAASIIESAYYIGMENSSLFENATFAADYTHLWSSAYGSHAALVSARGQEDTAHSLMFVADSLEHAGIAADRALSSGAPAQPKPQDDISLLPYAVVGLVLVAFACAALVFFHQILPAQQNSNGFKAAKRKKTYGRRQP